MLSQEKYEVMTAKTCRAALDIYKQHSSSINLCIMDLILPDLNGIGCAAEIKRINPDICLIANTGTRMPEKELLEQGFDFVLYKPWVIKDLLALIEEALD